MQTAAEQTVEKLMADAGFVRASMGGNVEAWRKDISSNQHVLITCGEDGTDLFGDPEADEWLACAYFHDRPDHVEGEDNSPMTLAAAFAWAEARRA